MIWVIGGTSEAADLVKRLKERLEFVITVATETGKDFLKDFQVNVKRMDTRSMVAFIEENKITAIVDVSHPYATEVTDNARAAQQQTGIEYLRFVRSKSDSKDAIVFASLDLCLQWLGAQSGIFFFTTGSKHVSQFQSVKGSNRFIYRVLPTSESIEQCRTNGVELGDIVATLGPFSEEYNQAMFKEYSADFVIMKNSGKRGGTKEKIDACKNLGIKPVIIERESEHGFTDIEELADYLLKKFGDERMA